MLSQLLRDTSAISTAPVPLRGRRRCALHSETALDHGACCGSSVGLNQQDQLLTGAGPGFDSGAVLRSLQHSPTRLDTSLSSTTGGDESRRSGPGVPLAPLVGGLGLLLWMLRVWLRHGVQTRGAAARFSCNTLVAS